MSTTLSSPLDQAPDSLPRSVRDWLADAICFLVSAVIAVLLTRFKVHSDATTLADVADIAVAAGGCLALWWRRRWPVPIAIALGVLTCYWPACQLPALISLGSVAVHGSRRPLIAVILVQLVSTAIRFVYAFPDLRLSLEIHSSSGTTDGAGAIISVLLLAIVIAGSSYVRTRRQLMASLRDRAEKAETEQYLRIKEARAGERARIAREMHDVLAHRISLISLQAGALQVSRQRSDDDVTDSATMIRGSAHRALDDLREVIGVLRADDGEPAPLTPQPTLTDIPGLVEESARAGMRVTLHQDLGAAGSLIPLPVGRTAYRVVQEGLTNARKHAPDAVVSVTVAAPARSGLQVEIRSGALAPTPASRNGTSPIPGGGQGLVGLSERARLVGGRLEQGWTPSGDFRLAAWLPIQEQR